MQAPNDPTIVELQNRLLSNNERARIELNRPQPELTYSLSFKDSRLHVFGTRHLSSDVDSFTSTVESRIQEINPDILLVEVFQNLINQVIEDRHIQQLPESQQKEVVLQEYGEQGFFAWSYQMRGGLVSAWDLPFEDQLKAAIQVTSPQAVLGWLSLYSIKVLMRLGRPLTPTNALQLIEQFNVPAEQISHALGIEVNSKALRQVAEHFTHYSFNELSNKPQVLENLTRPDSTSPTNLAFLSMNVARDKHALKIIYEALQQYKVVTVTSGSAHATAWQPAFQWLSAQNSQ